MTLKAATKTIRDIRAALSNANNPPELLADLSAEYGELCEQANERLDRIGRLLFEGYRDEAIQLSEQSPILTELVSILDFGESDEWKGLLLIEGIEVPVDLSMGIAEQIESAYGELQVLQPILKKHRLLALDKGPLKLRIVVLKKLMAMDPTNPIWAEDNETLQRARLDEIADEYRLAKSQNDADSLNKLQKEMEKPWDVAIPPTLFKNIVGASTSMARDQARSRLKKLLVPLNDCLVEFDDAKARSLRVQWDELSEPAELTHNDPLFLRVKETFDWLDELDNEAAKDVKFAAAVRVLENSVNTHAPIDVIDRGIYKVQQFERELPEALTHRVHHYRESLVIKKRRKTMLMISSAIVALGIMAGAVSWFIVASARQAEISNAIRDMGTFVQDNEFNSGKLFHEKLPESLRSNPKIIQLFDELNRNENKENDRVEKFNELLKLVRTPLENGGPLELELDDAIRSAKKIAESSISEKVLAEENDTIETLEIRLNTERLKRQAERNAIFNQAMQPLKAELSVLRQKNDIDTIASLRRLIEEIEILLSKNLKRIDGKSGVDSSLERDANDRIKQAKDQISNIELSNRSAAALLDLKSKISGSPSYSDALRSYVQSYPDSINSADFAETADEGKTRDGWNDWTETARIVISTDLYNLSADNVALLNGKITNAETKLQITDFSSAASLLKKILENEKTPVANPAGRLAQLKHFFQITKHTNISVVQRDGDHFYLENPIHQGEDSRFHYFESPEKEPVSQKIKKDDRTGKAAHCKIALEVIEALEREILNKELKTKKTILNLLEKCSARSSINDLDVDPLVMCSFADRIFLTAIKLEPEKSESAFKAFAKEQREKLKSVLEPSGQSIDWQFSSGSQIARQPADLYLKDLKLELAVLEEMVSQEQKDYASIKAWANKVTRFKICGMLYRDSLGGWKILKTTTIPNNVSLYCLAPTSDTEAKFERIAIYRNGAIETNQSVTIQAGRLVLVELNKK
jgi:hypothetical protein